MDPNSFDIHQPQATLINLITLLVWIPLLNFHQLTALDGGPLDRHLSIKGDPTGTGCRVDSPNCLEQAHVGLAHLTLPYREPEHCWDLTSWVPTTHCGLNQSLDIEE